jgi:helicase
MYPLLYVKQNEEDEYATEIENHGLDNVPKLWDVEYRNFLAKLKTSLLFFDWMNEKTEDHILERFNLPPGELYNKIKNAEWMLFAARELALIMEKTSIANEFNRLLLRIKHGVKEELLPLVSLPNIGRVRARMLWHNKIRNISDIKKVPDSILSEIIGQKIAKKLKEEINKGIA